MGNRKQPAMTVQQTADNRRQTGQQTADSSSERGQQTGKREADWEERSRQLFYKTDA
jgi:hypothetical protein